MVFVVSLWMRKEVIEHKDSLRAAVGLLGHCKMISALLKIKIKIINNNFILQNSPVNVWNGD